MFDTSPLKNELDELAEKLSKPQSFSSINDLSDSAKKYAQLHAVFDLQEQINARDKEIQAQENLLATEQDEELRHFAQDILEDDKKQKEILEKKLADLGKKKSDDKDEHDSNDIIIEIRAGVGGEEAALFAQALMRMYGRYAERKGWKFVVLDTSPSEQGGVKEAICEVHGKNVFSYLQYESGVHRVQRIPETEKAGRVHTSTASVAVLPTAEPIDLHIRPEDVRIDVYRSSGPGGQHANKTSSAVRVTHLPTGLVATSQQGRSQIENREVAMKILRTRLFQQREEEARAQRESSRREQIGAGARSEKIRTYNFPQDRITDHRVNESWHAITRKMDGEIDDIIETLRQAGKHETPHNF